MQADTNTLEHTEGAATAVQALQGDSFSANRINPDPICSISFGVKVKSLALSCRNDVVVKNGAAAPKSCLSPLEMCSSRTANDLLPAGMATTTATWISFPQLPLWFCQTEETILRTSIIYVPYFSSFG